MIVRDFECATLFGSYRGDSRKSPVSGHLDRLCGQRGDLRSVLIAMAVRAAPSKVSREYANSCGSVAVAAAVRVAVTASRTQ